MNTKHLIVGAAMAGLLSGTAVRVHASTDSRDAGKSALSSNLADSDKHSCKGKNDCKGKGGCKSGDNGCKGNNSCKGKGGCKSQAEKEGSKEGSKKE